jgi:hypothetical protein
MYHFSRSIYRELAPRVTGDVANGSQCQRKQQVLESCETAVRRLTVDGRYFARPARSLFNEIRVHFAMGDQLRVWKVVERNIALALIHLEQMPEDLDFDGQPRQCRAHTRKGTPCQRQPLPGRDYCPSHKHLEETFGGSEAADDLAEAELVAA